MKKITVYDVAREADVSLATVSRVMNGSTVVKEGTRKRVQEAIAKLGYRPNAIAQGLALQRTTSIGLIFPETINQTGQLLNGLCDVAKIYNYSITLHTVSEGITNIQEVVDGVIKSRVDGVIMYTNKNLDNCTDLLADYNIPLVVIGNRFSTNQLCTVFVDYAKAVEEKVSEYLDKGIKDIIILEDRRNKNITNDMIIGGTHAFLNHGLEFNNYLEYSNDERSTYKYLRSYFKMHKDKKLIIVSRDSQALAVLNAARENNISVPEDLEVICLNDSKYCSMVRPKISGFVIPNYDLGAVAMRVMTKMLQDEVVEDKQKVLGYLYRGRESTKE